MTNQLTLDEITQIAERIEDWTYKGESAYYSYIGKINEPSGLNIKVNYQLTSSKLGRLSGNYVFNTNRLITYWVVNSNVYVREYITDLDISVEAEGTILAQYSYKKPSGFLNFFTGVDAPFLRIYNLCWEKFQRKVKIDEEKRRIAANEERKRNEKYVIEMDKHRAELALKIKRRLLEKPI